MSATELDIPVTMFHIWQNIVSSYSCGILKHALHVFINVCSIVPATVTVTRHATANTHFINECL